jgi:hypothetical protein
MCGHRNLLRLAGKDLSSAPAREQGEKPGRHLAENGYIRKEAH